MAPLNKPKKPTRRSTEQRRSRLATLSDWIAKHANAPIQFLAGSGVLALFVGLYFQKATIKVTFMEQGIPLNAAKLEHINLRMKLNDHTNIEQGRNEGSQVIFENVKLSWFGSDLARFTLDASSKYILVDTAAQEVPESNHIPLKVILKMVPVRVPIQEYAVHTLQKITIDDVQAGEVVQVEASGSITVGSFVGNSTPEGRDYGVFGFSLTGYNIVKAFPHAALMYRFPGDDEWKLCGNGFKFKAASNGALTIQFQVNDADQGNNRGNYIVRITVQEQ